MKRLSLILLAALLALCGTALHVVDAKPVHADGGCGIPTDFDGVPYSDGYWGGPGYPLSVAFVTGADGQQHQLDLDVAAYRLTVGNGNCYRGFYASTWFAQHEYGYQTPRVNAWTTYNAGGGQRGPWTFNHGTYWDWGNYVVTWQGPGQTCETCGQLGPWGSYTRAVTLPNGRTQLMDFGISTGGPRIGETTGSHVDDCNPNCNFYITSYNGSGWFVQSAP